jgi:hypothetical protein
MTADTHNRSERLASSRGRAGSTSEWRANREQSGQSICTTRGLYGQCQVTIRENALGIALSKLIWGSITLSEVSSKLRHQHDDPIPVRNVDRFKGRRRKQSRLG